MYAYDFRYVNYYVEAVTGQQDGPMMCVCEEVRYGGGGAMKMLQHIKSTLLC